MLNLNCVCGCLTQTARSGPWLIEAFKKETPRIAKDLGLKDEQVGDVGGCDGVGHGVKAGAGFSVRQGLRVRDVSAQLHSVVEDSQDVQHFWF